VKYEMERDLLDELCAQHHESGWREGYEQCRREMTEECDKRIREAERHGGLADVGDRRDELIPRGRHLRMGRPHEVVSVTAELRKHADGLKGVWMHDREPLLEIADRIDAEHRRRIADVGRAACNAVREVCGS
jgi:hypothetical protein